MVQTIRSSGQELRVATYLSQDKRLLDAYAKNQDVYAIIASMITGYPYEECTEFYPEGKEIEIDGKKIICGYKTHTNKEGKARRKIGKVAVLAGNYGLGAAGVGQLMGGKSAKEGEEMLNKYFSMFPGLKKSIDDSKEILKKQGYVEDIIGRRRRLPDIHLKPYEVSLLKKSENNLNFNPFINCTDRQVKEPNVIKWEERLSQAIAMSHSGQLPNKKYEEMAKEAKKDNVLIQAFTGRIAQAERQCFNARIQGCLHPDTLIYTQNGIDKISNFKDQFIKVWDGKDWTISNVVYSGKKQKCILTTGIGNKIICSPDHRFLVINTAGQESFKRLANIKKQDRLICNENVPVLENKVLFRNTLAVNYSGPVNKHNYSFDDIKDDYIRGQILGRIASDGSYIKKQDGSGYIYILVAEHEEELLDYFKTNLPFKYSIRVEQKKNQKVYQLIISSRSLYEECARLNIKHEIPQLFYQNTALLKGFISGFFDGDGTANHSNIALDFGRQADFSGIIRQMQDCLLFFGIKSTAKEFKDRYRVAIRKVDSKKFAENIGFITSSKQTKALSKQTINDYHCFNNRSITTIKNIEITDEFIDMYDICDTERGYFIANGLVTHNSSGSLTKKAMLDIFNDEQLRQWGARLIITVHDEVLVECPEVYAEQVEKRLPEIMINAALELGITAPKMQCDPYNVSRWYASDIAVAIRAEFEKMEHKEGKEAALISLYNKYPEFPQECLRNVVEKGCDLDFNYKGDDNAY